METAAHGNQADVSPVDVAALYDRSFGEVYRYLCCAVLGNRALAEDLTQETFASIVAAVNAGRAEPQSMPWVIGVARHKLIDHYRRCESDKRRMMLAWSGWYGRANEQLDDLGGGDPARVADLLRELLPAHRLVLVLRYLDDLSVEEIANSIGRSVHATESLLVRARRALASTPCVCRPLQLLASIFGFLARDAVAGTGMRILAGTWLSISLVMWSAAPGSTSKALGLLLLVASMSMTAPAIASSMGKLVATAVLTTTSLRFALTGIYQLTGSSWRKHAAGFIGVALFALAAYAAFAFLLEDVRRATLLPTLRRGRGRTSITGNLRDQFVAIEREAGGREQL